jgi:AraC-like DNA-binding protein
MSPIRQAASPPQEADILLRSLGLGLPSGYRTGVHAHPWAQLVYATKGVLTISTGEGLWVVPSQRAVWIPPAFEHDVQTNSAARMQTIYIRPDLVPGLSTRCSVIPVSALLRELVLDVMRRRMLVASDAAQERLAGVLVDQLAESREAPLDLRMPKDPRARRVADRVLADVAAQTPLADLARGCGASLRTLERLFEKETTHTFGRWRQRARLLEALKRLASGDAVTHVALDVGYDSPSAFIAMFKRVLGTTPRQWVRGERSEASEQA